jgi:hypothetical protein
MNQEADATTEPIWKQPSFTPIHNNTPRMKLIKNARGLQPVDILNMDWSSLSANAPQTQFSGIASIVTDYHTETSRLVMDTYEERDTYRRYRRFFNKSGIIGYTRLSPDTYTSIMTPEIVIYSLLMTANDNTAWDALESNEGRYVLRASLELSADLLKEYTIDNNLIKSVNALRTQYKQCFESKDGAATIKDIVDVIRLFGVEIDFKCTSCTQDDTISFHRRSLSDPDLFMEKFKIIANYDSAELASLDWSDLYKQCTPLISEKRRQYGGELAFDGKRLKLSSLIVGYIDYWELTTASNHLFRFVVHNKDQLVPTKPITPTLDEIWKSFQLFISRECVWYCILSPEGLWIIRPSDKLADMLSKQVLRDTGQTLDNTDGICRDFIPYHAHTIAYNDYPDIFDPIKAIQTVCLDRQPIECIKDIGMQLRIAGVITKFIPNSEYMRLVKSASTISYWSAVDHTEYVKTIKMLADMKPLEIQNLDWSDIQEHLPVKWVGARLDIMLVDYGDCGYLNTLYVVKMRKDYPTYIGRVMYMLPFCHIRITWRLHPNAMPTLLFLNDAIFSATNNKFAWFVLLSPETRLIYKVMGRTDNISKDEFERAGRLAPVDQLRALGFEVFELPPLSAESNSICARIYTPNSLVTAVQSIPGLQSSILAELPKLSKMFDNSIKRNTSMYVLVRRANVFIGWCSYVHNVPQKVVDSYKVSAKHKLTDYKGWIDDLYISSKYRKEGHARYILNLLARKYNVIHVGIDPKDDASMTLFNTEGFTVVDESSPRIVIMRYTEQTNE